MNAQRWRRLEDLFHAALEVPDGEARAAFVERETAADADLRIELERMLREEEPGARLNRTVRGAAGLAVAAGIARARIGAYETIRELGRGGMGLVYLARRADDAFQKQVAIKLVRRGIDSDSARERFRRERQILARLEHPYIARLLDGGTTDAGLPFLVMEFVAGQPLVQYARESALDIAARIELFRKVCEAVDYAHQNLVVHRDLKPGNILVGSDGGPKLLDFGIARLLADDETGPQATLAGGGGVGFLTPDYASPEQIRGEPMGTTADVYSLGAVLYELLSGVPPFRLEGLSPASTEQMICSEDPMKPSARNQEWRRALSGDLDNIVLKAMRKRPEDRYRSAAELSDDLARFLAAIPVRARDYTLAERARRFVRRNRLGVAAATLACVGLVGGTALATWQAMEAHRQRATAEQEKRRAEANARAAQESAIRAAAQQLRAEQESVRAEAGKTEAASQREEAQAQQARADHRAAEMQQLAATLLNEIDSAIRDLPGATETRRRLLQAVQTSLDQVTKEAAPGMLLESDLALAYQRLGDIQGNPGNPNMGDLTGALASYGRAEDIWKRLLAAHPRDAEIRWLMATNEAHFSTVLLHLGRSSEALTRVTHGVEICEAVAHEYPNDPRKRLRLAIAWAQLAGTQSNVQGAPPAWEAARKARELYESVFSKEPADHDSREMLASAITIEGRAHMRGEELPDAVRLFRQAMAMRETLIQEQPGNLLERRRTMLLHGLLGDVLGNPDRPNLGDSAAALHHYREAERLADLMVQTDPKSGQAKSDRAIGRSRVAGVLIAGKQYAEALKAYESTIADMEELHRDRPQDRTMQANLAFNLKQAGECLAHLNDPRRRVEMYRRALDVATPLTVAANPDLTAALVSADAHLGLAEMLVADRNGEAAAHLDVALGMAKLLAVRNPTSAQARSRMVRINQQVDALVQQLGAASGTWKAAADRYREACEVWQRAVVASDVAGAKAAESEMERLRVSMSRLLQAMGR